MSARHRPEVDPRPRRDERQRSHRQGRRRVHQTLSTLVAHDPDIFDEVVLDQPVSLTAEVEPLNPPETPKKVGSRRRRHWKAKFWKRRHNWKPSQLRQAARYWEAQTEAEAEFE